MACTSDEFWDSKIWYADAPDFTNCFKDVSFYAFPTSVFCLVAIVELIRIVFWAKNSKFHPWTLLYITKVVLQLCIVLICVTDYFYASENFSKGNAASLMLRSTCKFVFHVGFLGFFLLPKTAGNSSSTLLCFCWILQMFCTFITHRSSFLSVLIQDSSLISEEQFISDTLYSSFVYSQCFLSLFSVTSASTEKSFIENENFFFYSLFTWMDKIIFQSVKKKLAITDLTPLPLQLKPNYLWKKFLSKWPLSSSNTNQPIKIAKSASLCLSLVKAFSWWTTLGVIWSITMSVISFVPVFLIGPLIESFQNDYHTWKPLIYGILFTSSIAVLQILKNWCMMFFNLAALQVKYSLMDSIYRKILNLSSSSSKNYASGELINLMIVDVDIVHGFVSEAFMVTTIPLKVLISVLMLWYYLGISCLAGISVAAIIAPVSYIVGKKMSDIQDNQMVVKDSRIKTLAEIISGIKILKLYAWEESFINNVNMIRQKEVNMIRKLLIYYAVSCFNWSCAPLMISVSCFITYLYINDTNYISANALFSSLGVVYSLRVTLFTIASIITSAVQTNISLKRLKTFLFSEEKDFYSIGMNPDEGSAISLKEATFSWNNKEMLVLRNLNLQIQKGCLVAIVGSVGSGKSSLLSTILGEMNKVSGSIDVKGSLAYVPQQAWIQNMTLKLNVLFTNPFDKTKYKSILDACCLLPDINQLPGGDGTEIGDKGANLSGGQKQRVSLARAVYADADIYLLDDPLSALDVNVGSQIFNNVIGNSGLLKCKTRVLVTHNLSILPFVDTIIIMRNGEIVETGSYEELQKKEKFSEFTNNHNQIAGDSPEINRVTENQQDISFQQHEIKITASDISRNEDISIYRSPSVKSLQREVIPELNEPEHMEAGNVKLKIYLKYIRHYGVSLFSSTLLCYILFILFEVLTNFTITEWSRKSLSELQDNFESNMNLIIIVSTLGIFQGIFVISANVLLAIGAGRASKGFHKSILTSLMKSPLSFYDTTPQGQIINRLNKDMDVIDSEIPKYIDWYACVCLVLLATFCVIGTFTPTFFLVLIPICISLYYFQKSFLMSSLALKRMEATTRSPIHSFVNESINGISSIRAYNVENQFIDTFERKLEANISCFFHWDMCSRWYVVRLIILVVIIITTAIVFAFYTDFTVNVFMGLAFIYALNLADTLVYMAQDRACIENASIAIERVEEYSALPSEAPWINEIQPDSKWPDNGTIEFRNFSCSYKKDLNMVLKNLNFKIMGKEKIGVIGRTGAGKSSLALSLFRIIEPNQGTIIIDNLDISKIGLHSLRKKLSIIPQDPILFTGSLRSNLDPENSFSDNAVWESLRKAHMKDFFSQLPGGLMYNIDENGKNLSVGQRQLICLARCLLRETKILIMDEATAAVDEKTDSLIRETIHSEFKDCTVLIIAHRLPTIRATNRTILLDNGEIVEEWETENFFNSQKFKDLTEIRF